jgi:putative acetyltransferase
MSAGGATYALRPFVPADTMALRELFAQSIEELTQEDYDEDQRAAWASAAEDAGAFMRRLSGMTTLVVQQEGEYLGFASLKDNKVLDMLYVHPWHAGEGVGTALADALERIATARGAETIIVDASETAVAFFESRGYEATQRNTVERAGEWLTNTTMSKQLKGGAGSTAQDT